jgi:hypothetical protein
MTLPESTRAWLYRVMLALAAVAAIYGLASKDELVAWIGLGTALLGNGLATANTSTEKVIP